MKMRNMIWGLDSIGDTALADSVMEFAEPPAGMATQYNREHNSCCVTLGTHAQRGLWYLVLYVCLSVTTVSATSFFFLGN